MTIIYPGWLLPFAAAALYIFYAVNKSNKIRKQNRREVLKAKQKELLTMFRNRDKNSNEDKNENS